MTLPAIGPRLAEFARRSGVAGFWPWWTSQLNAIVPPGPRAALERRRMRPVLVFDGDHATLWRPGMDGKRVVMVAASDVSLAGDAASVAAAGRAAVASLAAGGDAGTLPGKVVLSMPQREVLRKTLVLPAAVEPNLRQTLGYDLDRHTPFRADELYFDAIVVGRMPDRKEIRVDLVSCRKVVVDAALRHATAWGLTVAAAVPEPPAGAAHSRLNLLPHEARSMRALWKRWQFWLPLCLVALVALAAIAIPLWQKRDYAIALNAVAADAKAQAAVSERLRAELETKVADFNFALEKKYAFPSAFRVVDEISRVLPDDTWLTQFEMKSIAKGKETQREILVRGETANAGRLVQLFEESPLFAQTAPRSPTTKIQPGPGEIFDLGAQLKPLAAPAKVALLTAEKPAESAATSASPSAAAPTTPSGPDVPAGAQATAAAPTSTTTPAAPPAATTPAAPPAASSGSGSNPAPAANAATPATSATPASSSAPSVAPPEAAKPAPASNSTSRAQPASQDPWLSAPASAPSPAVSPRPARGPVAFPKPSGPAPGFGGTPAQPPASAPAPSPAPPPAPAPVMPATPSQ